MRQNFSVANQLDHAGCTEWRLTWYRHYCLYRKLLHDVSPLKESKGGNGCDMFPLKPFLYCHIATATVLWNWNGLWIITSLWHSFKQVFPFIRWGQECISPYREKADPLVMALDVSQLHLGIVINRHITFLIVISRLQTDDCSALASISPGTFVPILHEIAACAVVACGLCVRQPPVIGCLTHGPSCGA